MTRARSSAASKLEATAGAFCGALHPPSRGKTLVPTRHESGTQYANLGLGVFGGKPVALVHFWLPTAPATLPVGEWHHLAASYDGIEVKLYVDGVLSGSRDIGWPIAADTTNLIIGARQLTDTVKDGFNGAIDDVRLFSAALSEAEIKKTM